MFDLENPDNLVVFGGLVAGGALALAVLFGLAFSGLGAKRRRLSPGQVLSGTAKIAGERPGALAGLWLGLGFVSAFIGLLGQVTGLSLVFANTLLAAATVFLGHRTMLEPAARGAGIDLPRDGFWSLLLRSIAFGAIVIGATLTIFLAAALINAVAATAGASGRSVPFLVGAVCGIAAIALSVVFARMSFIYPSCVLGGRDWFATAVSRSSGAGLGLATALWLMAVLFVLLAIPALLATDALMAAATSTQRDLSLLDPYELDLSSPGVWAAIIVEEFALGLLVIAYSLASIACVSAAYRICVLEKAGEETAPG